MRLESGSFWFFGMDSVCDSPDCVILLPHGGHWEVLWMRHVVKHVIYQAVLKCEKEGRRVGKES